MTTVPDVWDLAAHGRTMDVMSKRADKLTIAATRYG